jgi:hypothetical protein
VKTAIGLLMLALALATAPALAGNWSPTAPDGTPKDEEWCRLHGRGPDPWCADLESIRRLPEAKRATVKPVPLRILPPQEYDKPFDGYLEIVRTKDEQEMQGQCAGAKFGPHAWANGLLHEAREQAGSEPEGLSDSDQ